MKIVSSLIGILLLIYILFYEKNSKLEMAVWGIYPFAIYINGAIGLYLFLLIVIKNLFQLFQRGKVKVEKQYRYLLLFVIYIMLCIPVLGFNHAYYIGIRNFVFFSLAGYYTIYWMNYADRKVVRSIVGIQIISSFLISAYEVCIKNEFVLNQNKRSYGFFNNPNYYAMYLVFLLLLAIVFYKKIELIGACFLLAPSIIASLSATAFICTAYILYFFFVKGRMDKFLYGAILISIGIIFIALHLNPHWFYNVWGTINDTDRLQLWEMYIKMFSANNPIIGVGFNKEVDMFSDISSTYIPYNEIGRIMIEIGNLPTHNEWLKLLTSTGIVGFAIFFIGFSLFFREQYKNTKFPNVGMLLLIMMATHNVFFTFAFWLTMFYPVLFEGEREKTQHFLSFRFKQT